MKMYVVALLALIVFSAPGLCDNASGVDVRDGEFFKDVNASGVDACVTGVDRAISEVAPS